MACTTILVGKKASYDGSTIIARNDDSGSGHYMPKKFVVVEPGDLPFGSGTSGNSASGRSDALYLDAKCSRW